MHISILMTIEIRKEVGRSRNIFIHTMGDQRWTCAPYYTFFLQVHFLTEVQAWFNWGWRPKIWNFYGSVAASYIKSLTILTILDLIYDDVGNCI